MIKKNLLIIIPARSGSKTIKNKNIVKLHGKPLIEYSFIASKLIKEKSKEIFCSTDSKKIQKMAIKKKINADILRPKKFSSDLSRDIDFVNHTLDIFYKKKIVFKNGLILRPTNPFRSKKNINSAYKKFLKLNDATSLKSIIQCKKTPFKTWIIKRNFLKPVSSLKSIKEFYNAPRQILPVAFDQTGTYEFFRIRYKKKLKTVSGKKITYFINNNLESTDIDKLEDIFRIKK